jgi:nucleotide sugar dehydrogenase
MKKIAVIGYGYVGKAMARLLYTHYEVWIYDPFINEHIEDLDNVYYTNDENRINECELAVICVPTPQGKDGHCDTSIVEDTLKWLKTPLILIKSTVKPGFIDRMKKETGKRIIFSPEYIGESTYQHNYSFQTIMENTPFLILGGDKKDTSAILDLFVPILGPQKTYYQVSAKEAEVIKYMENTYFAVKVIFANEMKKICDVLGVDYYTVRTGWALDPRVDQMHTMVFPDKPGFGGKCLPKDTSAIVKAVQEAGYNPIMLEAMIKSNNKIHEDINNS